MNWQAAPRTAIIDNSGGGYSSLAHGWSRLAGRPLHDLDALLWRPGWSLTPVEDYEAQHLRLIEQDKWVIDGIGRPESLLWRLNRATYIILVDLPLWTHFSLAARRQVERGRDKPVRHPVGYVGMPDMDALFEMIWTIDRDWMPNIRDMVAAEAQAGKPVRRITSLHSLREVVHEYFRS